MNLIGVRRFRINSRGMRETEEAIRSAGKDGYESFVLWSGTRVGEVFTVGKVHVPDQTSYKSDSGLCVRVDGCELHRLNVWLFETQQIIGVQIHSHPAAAYHSETDDTYPIATQMGSMSIVFPFFGTDGWRSNGIAAYRLGYEGWVKLTEPLSTLIEVSCNGIS